MTHPNGTPGRPPNSTGLTVLDDELVGLLAAVEREEPYYEPSLPQSLRYIGLCRLESLGYVRYCPYPEDFWVILPAGREVLSRSSP